MEDWKKMYRSSKHCPLGTDGHIALNGKILHLSSMTSFFLVAEDLFSLTGQHSYVLAFMTVLEKVDRWN
jgi:hypothetical protein